MNSRINFYETYYKNLSPTTFEVKRSGDKIIIEGFDKKYPKNFKPKDVKQYPVNQEKFNNGGQTKSWKNKYNKKYGYSANESHSIKEISKDTGVSVKGLNQIYKKGVGARKNNPQSVRSVSDGKKRGGKSLKGKMGAQQWAMARIYSSVMGGKAAKVDAKELKMRLGGMFPDLTANERDQIMNTYLGNKFKDGGAIDLVHVYDKDGSLYGTGEIEKREKGKTYVRFDAETVKPFDSEQVRPIMYKGGEVEQYNKWKAVNWDSLVGSKTRSNLYRIIGWNESERIDWSKMNEDDRDFFFDKIMFVFEDDDELTELMFNDNAEEIEKEFQEMVDLEEAETMKEINKALNSKEYKDLKVKMNKYGLSAKEVLRNTWKGLVDIMSKDTTTQDKIEYFIVDDEGWSEYKYAPDYDLDYINKLYDDLLESGAVFTEEAEVAQFDLFAEPKSESNDINEAELLKELKEEISFLNELLQDAKEEEDKATVKEMESRIDFLSELQEGVTPYQKGGGINKFTKIIVKFNTQYNPMDLTFYGLHAHKPAEYLGKAETKIYLPSSNVLNLSNFKLESNYNTPEMRNKLINIVKNKNKEQTGKSVLMINNKIEK